MFVISIMENTYVTPHLRSLKILVQILVVLGILDALKDDVSLHVSHSHHLKLVANFQYDICCTYSAPYPHIAALGFTKVSDCTSFES